MVQKLTLALVASSVALAAGLVISLFANPLSFGEINNLKEEIAAWQTEIEGKNSMISSLNTQLQALQDGLDNGNSDAAYLEAQISGLESQIATLYNLLYLNASAILLENEPFTQEPNNTYTVWSTTEQPLLYSGYLTAQIQSSSNSTYVQVQYYSRGVYYDNKVELGSGTAAFPVLPGEVAI